MSTATSQIELLARQLERDIKVRGLRPGDRYLTADEAGRLLQVSTTMAHQALRMLADRDVVKRQRRSGTFVGDALQVGKRAVRKKVHILIASDVGPDQAAAMNFLSNDLLAGISETMLGVSVQIDVVSPNEGMAFVRDLVENGETNGDFAGAILVRATLPMQRFFQDSGLPAIVYGSRHPGVTGLGNMEVNQEQIGRLTAEYLIRQRHEIARILVFNYWAPGDNTFIASFMRTLQTRRGGPKDYEIVSVPSDEEVIRSVIQPMMLANDRPSAIVARTSVLARPIAQTLQDMGLSIPNDVDLIIGNYHKLEVNGRWLPRAIEAIDARERGRRLGRALLAMGAGEDPATLCETVDVRYTELEN